MDIGEGINENKTIDDIYDEKSDSFEPEDINDEFKNKNNITESEICSNDISNNIIVSNNDFNKIIKSHNR